MATIHAVLQARNHLSCRSRGNDTATIQIVSPLPYNPAHARPFALIRSKEPIPTSDDLPALYLDAFLGHKGDQSSDAISYRGQVFPGFVQSHVLKPYFSDRWTGRRGIEAHGLETLNLYLSRACES